MDDIAVDFHVIVARPVGGTAHSRRGGRSSAPHADHTLASVSPNVSAESLVHSFSIRSEVWSVCYVVAKHASTEANYATTANPTTPLTTAETARIVSQFTAPTGSCLSGTYGTTDGTNRMGYSYACCSAPGSAPSDSLAPSPGSDITTVTDPTASGSVDAPPVDATAAP
jgi:hypothetical protein